MNILPFRTCSIIIIYRFPQPFIIVLVLIFFMFSLCTYSLPYKLFLNNKAEEGLLVAKKVYKLITARPLKKKI